MKDTKRNTILVLLILVIISFILIKDHYTEIAENLSKANIWLILLAVGLIVLYWVLKSICLLLIVGEHNKKIRFRDMLRQTLITQFFNGITPFSTGGQPMQIYMLRNSGIKVGPATNIIIQDFLMYQLALITIGLLSIIGNQIFHFFEISSGLYTLLMLGFIINIIVGLCLLFISFSRKFNNFIGELIIKIGAKVKIIKNKEKVIESWREKLDEFHESAKIFKKRKILFLECFIFNVLALLSYYIIPFFIFLSFDKDIAITVPKVIISSAFVLLVGNFVPIPGGSGGIEYSFSKIFGSFLNDSLIVSGLIIWRAITYYLGIIIGAITLAFYKRSEKK